MFEEEQNKKFQPFLGSLSGAVKVKYQGSKKRVKLTVEVWEEGTKTEVIGSITSLMGDEKEKILDGEFIVSVKEKKDKEQMPIYEVTSALVHKNGSSSSIQTIEKKDPSYTMHSPFQLHQNIKVNEDEEAIVWGFQASDEGGLSVYQTIDENIQHAKWAVAIKMSLED